MIYNYWLNFNLFVGDKWVFFLIEMFVKNRVLGNKNYKVLVVLRKK